MGLLVAHFLNDQHCRAARFRHRRVSRLSVHLLNAITEDNDYFQPTNINFGLMPPVEGMRCDKREAREKKREIQLERAKESLQLWLPPSGVLAR